LSAERVQIFRPGEPLAVTDRVARLIADRHGSFAKDEIPLLFGGGDVMAAYSNVTQMRTPAGTRGARVGVVQIRGLIMQHSDLWGYGTSTEVAGQQVRDHVADGVDVVVLAMSSPGGSVYGVHELYEEVLRARSKVLVIAAVNSMCASAAYYIASAASEIVTTPSGELGSIGVYCGHVDESRALDAQGVKVTLVASDVSPYKTEGNPYEPLADSARAHMQRDVNAWARTFVESVAKGRGVTPSVVAAKFGQGRMVRADEAVRRGMADRVQPFAALMDGLRGQAGDQLRERVGAMRKLAVLHGGGDGAAVLRARDERMAAAARLRSL
jgi:signal peptide peptidase SppA